MDSDTSSPRAVIGALPLPRPRGKRDSLLSRPDGHAQDIVHLLNAGWWVLGRETVAQGFVWLCLHLPLYLVAAAARSHLLQPTLLLARCLLLQVWPAAGLQNRRGS